MAETNGKSQIVKNERQLPAVIEYLILGVDRVFKNCRCNFGATLCIAGTMTAFILIGLLLWKYDDVTGTNRKIIIRIERKISYSIALHHTSIDPVQICTFAIIIPPGAFSQYCTVAIVSLILITIKCCKILAVWT
ncbi:hypothetical protein MAR_003540 [Mya arenaria]|uniref:Uncharacterized protein n=1 Tax=Mya arenaria TaxID=6604 RepID=A0ABY7G7S6_MYAAR|nr:hypothetical protein MAR_003540 [Mya arenaria]